MSYTRPIVTIKLKKKKSGISSYWEYQDFGNSAVYGIFYLEYSIRNTNNTDRYKYVTRIRQIRCTNHNRGK